MAPDGEGRPGARVVAVWNDGLLGGQTQRTVRTGAGGTFVVATAESPEPVRLQAFAAGLAPSVPIDVLREAAASPIEIRLRRGGTVSLRAVRAEDSRPVRAAEVRVTTPDAPDGPAGRGVRVLTDEAGRAVVGSLAEGIYEVRVQAPGRLAAVRSNVLIGARTAEQGADLGDVMLEAGQFLTGNVVRAGTGAPVAGARVAPAAGARNATGESATVAVARSDARGRFRLGPVTPETEAVRVVKLGFRPQIAALPADGGDLGTIALRRDEGRTAMEADIGPAGPGLVVRRRDGAAVVAQVVPGSPAEEAGIAAGDRLLEAGGYPAALLTRRELLSVLRGDRGTRVRVAVASADGPSWTVDLDRR